MRKLLLGAVCCALLLALAQARSLKTNTYDPEARKRIVTLDEDARIYLWKGFLTPEECDYLRLKAEKRLERSGVVDSGNGGSVVSEVRTSDGMFFERGEDALIEAVEQRLADWTMTPIWAGEALQVLRYRKDQKYDSHWDFFFHKEGGDNGGNRWSTVLMYLAETEEGGETVFSKIPAPNGINNGFSACAKHHLAVKPRKGDALLFHSMKPGGELEPRSMHGACPVIKGEKFSMTKIHAGHYDMNDLYDERAREYQARLASTLDTSIGTEL
ncbi:Prolyl 4-hydroxylase subunit alpha-2 [Tetrabaena socialis]|uniref:procollagen-proline 4-dioxygenase n=1 Tax=Tetrabaena socialis TaxID=47790 RepID=A0A2J7ZU51_9CHLO|nr:Prolyl 4-hydroxylase subunit alpha-2 [Tetrabaena socialis]|eukprot:PNH03801.1 Prolyl 4-hydroxylase subunit alpha-2 [Tetrabaena socialis]